MIFKDYFNADILHLFYFLEKILDFVISCHYNDDKLVKEVIHLIFKDHWLFLAFDTKRYGKRILSAT